MNTPRRLGFIAILVLVGGCHPHRDEPAAGGQTPPTDFLEIDEFERPFVYDGEVPASTPPFEGGESIRVCCWNVKQFANRTPEEIETMAKVLGKYDLVGIVEVKQARGPARLFRELEQRTKSPWGFMLTPKTGRAGSNEREAYCFLWKADHIRRLTEAQESPAPKMTRQPYYARFQTTNSQPAGPGRKPFDFTFALIHTKPEPTAGLREELKKLVAHYRYLQSRDPDTILGGDFNAGPVTSTNDRQGGQDRDFTAFFQTYSWGIKEDKVSTNTERADGQGIYINDNLIWDQPTSEDFDAASDIDMFDRIYFMDTVTHQVLYDQARSISDHRPVWARFKNDRDTN